MDLLVLSRREAGAVVPSEPYVVVSITDPNLDAAELADSPDRRAVLRLRFHDVAGTRDPFVRRDAADAEVAMSDRDADDVVAFVHANVRDDVRLIVAHCEAGISRSAAVAAAVSKIWNGDDGVFFERYLPNSWVYRLVLERHAAARDDAS